MNLRIWIAGVVAINSFGWLKRANATPPIQESTTTAFPQSIEVIPDKLKVKVFLHEIKYKNETIPCWTYLTDGLMTQKQKEIMFTLRRDKDQKLDDYPRSFLWPFRDHLSLRRKGDLVDVGGVTLFGDTGFMGHKDFRGIGYVEPQGLPGVETGECFPPGRYSAQGGRSPDCLESIAHSHHRPPGDEISILPLSDLVRLEARSRYVSRCDGKERPGGDCKRRGSR